MPDFLHLRLAGPFLSLQGPKIDGHSQALEIPSRSMLTGLLGAALGIERREATRLQALHDAITLAVVVHRAGVPLVDFQTTDLTKPHMRGPMWLSGGRAMRREGSPEALVRHVQRRPYLCDADMSAVIELSPLAGSTLEAIVAALQRPYWPLGLGRMCCIPSRPLLEGLIEAADLVAAAEQAASPGEIVYLPASLAPPSPGDRFVTIPDRRDWHTRRHGGATIYARRAL